MWIFTDFGFFSIVQKPEDRGAGCLTVRARVKGDLDNLCTACGLDPAGIVTVVKADYRYRIRIDNKVLSQVMAAAIDGISYDNFKNRVTANQGYERARFYHGVWDVAYEMQTHYLNTTPKPARGGRTMGQTEN